MCAIGFMANIPPTENHSFAPLISAAKNSFKKIIWDGFVQAFTDEFGAPPTERYPVPDKVIIEKRPRRKTTPKMRAKIIALIRANTKQAEIARKVGVNPMTVHHIAKELETQKAARKLRKKHAPKKTAAPSPAPAAPA